MSELRRILLSRRTILYLFIAVFLAGIFFIYDCFSEKEITLSGDSLTAYLESYPEFLKAIESNAESFSTITALSEGFSAENIKKTVIDYSKLKNIVPIYGINKGIVLISDYVVGDFLIVGVVLLISVSFIEEKRKGLTFLVRSTKNGRIQLSIQRTAIIIIISLITSALVHAALFAAAQLTCGDMNVFRPIQSIPEFSHCPFSITILDYLIQSMLIKALSAAVMGLLLYLLPCVFEPVTAIIIFGAAIAAELLSFNLILPTDRLSPLKFCNITALLRADIFFKEYSNLNFFGNAVSFYFGAAVTGSAALVLLIALCILFTSNDKGTSANNKLTEKISVLISKKTPISPLWLWEMKKLFINQKGIIVLAVIVYVSVSAALQYRYLLPSYTEYELMYYDKYSGVITEEMLSNITRESEEYQAEFDETAEEYLRIFEENGRIITDELLDIYDKLQALGDRLDALDRIKAQALSGLKYTSESGIKVEMVKTAVYELLLINDKSTTDKNALYILLCIIGIFSGINANENRSNMNSILKTAYKGRVRLTSIKLIIIAVTSLLVTLGISLPQLYRIGEFGYNNLNAAAQSLDFLRFMPFELSIMGYLILMMGIRVFSAFIIGGFVMLVSRYCRSYVTAMCICTAILLIPSVLSGTGLLDIINAADFIGFRVL